MEDSDLSISEDESGTFARTESKHKRRRIIDWTRPDFAGELSDHTAALRDRNWEKNSDFVEQCLAGMAISPRPTPINMSEKWCKDSDASVLCTYVLRTGDRLRRSMSGIRIHVASS